MNTFVTMSRSSLRRGRPLPRGASLVVVMLLLTAVAMMALSIARSALVSERAARNERDRQLAYRSAMAALADAEFDVLGAGPASTRQQAFASGSSAYFDEYCTQGQSSASLGLCLPAPAGETPRWMQADFAADAAAAGPAASFGHFTGRHFAAGDGLLPARAPRYLIERLSLRLLGESAAHDAETPLYRITAMGFGSRDATRVVLQQTYRPAAKAGDAVPPGMAGAVSPFFAAAGQAAPGAAAATAGSASTQSAFEPSVDAALIDAGNGTDRSDGNHQDIAGPTQLPALEGNTPKFSGKVSSCAASTGDGEVEPEPDPEAGLETDADFESETSAAAESGTTPAGVTLTALVLINGVTTRIRVRADEAGLHVEKLDKEGSEPVPLMDFGADDDDAFALLAPFQKPVIARFRTGSGVSGNAAVSAGGQASSGYFLVSASAVSGVLFLLSLDKSAGTAWQHGRNYFRLEPLASGAPEPGILSAPVLVAGLQGWIENIFAGDSLGNLWQFDFRASAGSAGPHAPAIRQLFLAVNQQGRRQPVVVRPAVAYAPGGHLVLFGTGRPLEQDAPIAVEEGPESFYAVLAPDPVRGGRSVDRLLPRRGDLAQRFLKPAEASTGQGSGGSRSPAALQIDGQAFVYGASSGQKQGWFFDFYQGAQTGERLAGEALLAHGKVFFNSRILAAGGCTGAGRSYALDALSGLSGAGMTVGTYSARPLLARPRLVELGLLGPGASFGDQPAGPGARRYAIRFSPAGGAVQAAGAADFSSSYLAPAGRLSWREIGNWTELHEGFQ